MIDYDALKETRRGRRFDRLVALLIGLIALLAAALVVVQSRESLAEARASAQARRLGVEVSMRAIAFDQVFGHRGTDLQRALLQGAEANARSMVALQAGDAAAEQIGTALGSAASRFGTITTEMGRPPDDASPLDPYARDILGTTAEALRTVATLQHAWADAATAASTRSSRAVMGLSVVALAGVLGGLAAVVGSGRTGRALLLLAWLAAIGALGLLLAASGVLPS